MELPKITSAGVTPVDACLVEFITRWTIGRYVDHLFATLQSKIIFRKCRITSLLELSTIEFSCLEYRVEVMCSVPA
jgi:hypothetical protein